MPSQIREPIVPVAVSYEDAGLLLIALSDAKDKFGRSAYHALYTKLSDARSRVRRLQPAPVRA